MRVVVIGAGIMGASAAFHLAEAGVEVTVVERANAASGSSGKPVGGVRAQFSDPVNIELGARSLREWQRFDTRPGGDISLERVGYLFLLSREADIPVFEDAVALQRTFDVPSRMLTAAEVHAHCPWIPTGSVLAGTFSPSDGHARPPAAVRAYLAAAVALGGVVRERTEVVGIRMHGDRVVGVDVALRMGRRASDPAEIRRGPLRRQRNRARRARGRRPRRIPLCGEPQRVHA